MSAAAPDLVHSLAQRNDRDMLRFVTCGNVDDGKSTLIGRLLHDSGRVPEDQFAAVRRDSERWGTTGKAPDLALLVDGLQAEREQAITIDVAYRYFHTTRRKFILADTPGHEQYTRNMATGASTADLAIVLVDALKGVSAQTRRHAMIATLLGIRHLVIAINKMDAVHYDREVFDKIRVDCSAILRELGDPQALFIPLSALVGDNVVHRSDAMPWYHGPALLAHLETLDVTQENPFADLRLPIQLALRPDAAFRGYAGTLQAGFLRVGDDVLALPSGRTTQVRSILVSGRSHESASRGDSVTLTLEDEIDLVRGDVLVHPTRSPGVTDSFEAHIVWMSDAPLLPGRQYDLKVGHRYVTGHVERIEHRIDMERLEHPDAKQLEFNEIALCRIVTTAAVVIDPYALCRATGSLILIDRLTQATVGAGMILRSVPHTDLNARRHLLAPHARNA